MAARATPSGRSRTTGGGSATPPRAAAAGTATSTSSTLRIQRPNDGSGSDRLHLMDTASRRELSLPKLPLGVIGDLQFHHNSRDLGFTLSSARSPSDVYSIDVTTGKLDRWTESETGGLDASTFSEP